MCRWCLRKSFKKVLSNMMTQRAILPLGLISFHLYSKTFAKNFVRLPRYDHLCFFGQKVTKMHTCVLADQAAGAK